MPTLRSCCSSPDAPLSSRPVCPFACTSFPLWCVKGTWNLHQKWNLIFSSQPASAAGFHISVNGTRQNQNTFINTFPSFSPNTLSIPQRGASKTYLKILFSFSPSSSPYSKPPFSLWMYCHWNPTSTLAPLQRNLLKSYQVTSLLKCFPLCL